MAEKAGAELLGEIRQTFGDMFPEADLQAAPLLVRDETGRHPDYRAYTRAAAEGLVAYFREHDPESQMMILDAPTTHSGTRGPHAEHDQ